MKKSILFFSAIACVASSLAWGAVNVKKAASVSAKKADAMESATSLVPTVIGLVGNVKALNNTQEQLSADCAVSGDEVNTVNELVKEWAKTGTTRAQDAAIGLGTPCPGSYQDFMNYADDKEVCYETFSGASDVGMIWEGFPKAAVAKRCDAATNKDCQNVSNVYDIFAKIPFNTEDYMLSESNKIVKLKEKAERCAPAKLRAAKRELYGDFVVQTLGGLGQSSGAAGTANVLDAVQSMGGSGDIKNILPSLGQMAMQGLDK